MSVESPGESESRFKIPSPKNVLRVALAAGAIYIGYRAIDRAYEELGDDDRPNATQTQDLQIFQDGIEELPQNEKIQQYFNLRFSFEDFYRNQLDIGTSGETEGFLTTKRKEIAVSGAFVIESIGTEVTINSDGEKINAYDREFDLNKDFDISLLDAIITKALASRYETNTEEGKYLVKKQLEDLIWLANEDVDVNFEPDYYTFYPTDYLVILARHRRVLSNLGYPLPAKTVYKLFSDGDLGAGWYRSEENTVYVTEIGDFAAVVHEDAHHQADRNPTFTQDYFNQIITGVMEEAGLELHDTDAYIKPPDLKESGERILIEAYANTLQVYFTDGVSFRRKIKDLELTGNPAASVLTSEYQFAKDFYGGAEFIQNGEVLNPQVGDVFVINDPEGFERGIGLRPNPTHLRLLGIPAVHDGDAVKIISGPENVVDPYTGIAKNMWFVEPGIVPSPHEEFYSRGSDLRGWISEEWLGAINHHAVAEPKSVPPKKEVPD